MHKFNEIDLDFERDVWCLYGLPVDNLSMTSVVKEISGAVKRGNVRVLSTINFNWIVTSLKSDEFRKAVIDSDICTIDGVPLLWMAKLFQLPMREVVSGSSLIERLYLYTPSENRITMYLFGGEKNAAKVAASRINEKSNGLNAVGWRNPGFGSIKQLSEQPYLNEINACSPDVLLVALGAHKGQLWINQNKGKLNAKIISHLGATINFIGGLTKRAPKWMQKTGLEWVWRIIQDPKLFSRYFSDAEAILKIALSDFFLLKRYRNQKKKYQNDNFSLKLVMLENGNKLLVSGSYHISHINMLREIFKNTALKRENLELCFLKAKFIDNQFLGMLLLLIKQQSRSGKVMQITGVNKKIEQILTLNMICKSLRSMGFDQWKAS